ncbi:fructosamine kinase family protein [Guptibacillus spartinae]|uniref:fructosamine kinase family protein n=1 Tax=Guptibacillus spartinae TaxID=3025679 RepID=UPI002361F1C5|nr:fructosamine kinase family protein [Pseudalkalibacillus spartinae]
MKNIEEAIRKAGDFTTIVKVKRVSGGSINDAFYVQTQEREYFAKSNPSAPADFFRAEKEGLELLSSHKISVPKPLLLLPKGESDMVFLMEWIRSSPSSKEGDRALGSLVARMHRNKVQFAGLEQDNYIGELDQKNQPSTDWVSFFRDQRLGTMQELARNKRKLSVERDHRLTALRERLDTIIGHHPDFSLLHGDLWGGNWLMDDKGEPYLIDPAVYYGDREIDIAFTYLFGGYSKEFYQQYQADLPLEKEFKDRIPIYQLYYLLVHLILFGESYGSAVDRILQKYTV